MAHVLQQGGSQVFECYSQTRLMMMLEALTKLDGQAEERGETSLTLLTSLGAVT